MLLAWLIFLPLKILSAESREDKQDKKYSLSN